MENFRKDFRKAVKAANPNAIILAEHYGNPEGWLKGDEWDTVMNYDAFMEPLTWFLTGMEKHSDEYREDLLGNSEAFIGAMKTHMRALHMSALQTAMNELSNHDHSRFLTRTNHRVGRISYAGPEAASEGVNPAVMREAVTIQMTWPGAPTGKRSMNFFLMHTAHTKNVFFIGKRKCWKVFWYGIFPGVV